MNRRIEAVLRLAAVPGYGPARTRGLMQHLVSRGEFLEFLPEYEDFDLLELGMSQDQIDSFRAVDPEQTLAALEDSHVRLITMMDGDAPDAMRNGDASPWYFAIGDTRMLNAESLGFSGSRDASPQALEATTRIASAAAGRGWTVISGGARGIDTAGHLGAVEAGGCTVIVLAQGIFGWRPSENLAEAHVLVLSEFLPADDWGSYRAFQRNKSIIHLSDRLIIPQAGLKGGTMNAAEYALKTGHPTYVLDLGPDFPGNAAIARKGARVFPWTGDPSDLDLLDDASTTGGHAQLPLP